MSSRVSRQAPRPRRNRRGLVRVAEELGVSVLAVLLAAFLVPLDPTVPFGPRTASTVETQITSVGGGADDVPGLTTPVAVADDPLVVFPRSGPAGTWIELSGPTNGARTVSVGTAAELSTGSATSFSRCPGDDPRPDCFTVTGTAVRLSRMPAHPLGATVVSLESASGTVTAGFTYTDVPGTPEVTAKATPAGAHVQWYRLTTGAEAVSSITVTPVRNGVAQSPRTLPGSASSVDLDGLTVGASYGFAVRATSGAGQGVTSRVSGSVVPFTSPGAMAAPTATVSRRGVTVSWLPPDDDGHQPPTGYTVSVWLGKVSLWSGNYPATTTSTLMDSTPPGQTVSFSVTAANDAGQGPDSARSAPVTTNGGGR